MLKLISLRKNYDSYWLVLQPGDKSLQILSSIFDLHDIIHDHYKDCDISYKKLLINGEISFFKDYTLDKSSPKFAAYFILTSENIHVILRKIKGYEKVFSKILKYYDFPIVKK